MLNFISKPGSVLSLLMGFMALGAVIAVALISVPRPLRPVVSSHDLRAALVRVGLGSAELTVVGADEVEVAAVVGAAREHLANSLTALHEADQAQSTLALQVAGLVRFAERGAASSGQVETLGTARSQLASAESSVQTALNNFFNAATAGLIENQRSMLITIRSNRAREVPLDFKLISRTDAQWLALRESLMQEQLGVRHGTPVSQGAVTLLSGTRGEEESLAARSQLSEQGGTNAEAWDAAVQTP